MIFTPRLKRNGLIDVLSDALCNVFNNVMTTSLRLIFPG